MFPESCRHFNLNRKQPDLLSYVQLKASQSLDGACNWNIQKCRTWRVLLSRNRFIRCFHAFSEGMTSRWCRARACSLFGGRFGLLSVWTHDVFPPFRPAASGRMKVQLKKHAELLALTICDLLSETSQSKWTKWTCWLVQMWNPCSALLLVWTVGM